MKTISVVIVSFLLVVFFKACSINIKIGDEEIDTLTLEYVSNLNSAIDETSGLAKVDGKIYTHNDGGSLAALYEINATSGEVIRTVTVDGATNIDWEGLATDETHLYIADIGNNLGSRTDLRIYKILKDDIINGDTVTYELISFSYEDQTLFDYANYSTPYDAEAIVAYNGQLYIFTKNWDDYTSSIYTLPSTAGDYVASFVSEKQFDVMVTDADIDLVNNKVALIGYENHIYDSSPKNNVILLSSFTNNDFFSGNIVEYETQRRTTFQMEAILFNTASEFYFTSERLNYSIFDFPARLYKVEISN